MFKLEKALLIIGCIYPVVSALIILSAQFGGQGSDLLIIGVLGLVCLGPVMLLICLFGIGATFATKLSRKMKVVVALTNVTGVVFAGWFTLILLGIGRWVPINPG